MQRDHNNERGFIPFQDPDIPGQTFYQTVQGWQRIYAIIMGLRFAGHPR